MPSSAVPPQFQGHPALANIPTVAVPDATGTMVTQHLPGVIPSPLPAKAPPRPDRLEVRWYDFLHSH